MRGWIQGRIDQRMLHVLVGGGLYDGCGREETSQDPPRLFVLALCKCETRDLWKKTMLRGILY